MFTCFILEASGFKIMLSKGGGGWRTSDGGSDRGVSGVLNLKSPSTGTNPTLSAWHVELLFLKGFMANCSRIHSSMASELLGQLTHTAFGLKSLEYLIGKILFLGPSYVTRVKSDRGFFFNTLHKHWSVPLPYYSMPIKFFFLARHFNYSYQQEGRNIHWELRESQGVGWWGYFADSANVAFCPEEFNIQNRLSPDSSLSLCQDKKEEP